MGYRSFEDVDVWKRGCRVAVRVYEVLKDCRDYGLRDQMTRAAVSIASNIAEGTERDSPAETIHFLHIAKGSAAELRTQLYIAHRIGVIDHPIQTELTTELKEGSVCVRCWSNPRAFLPPLFKGGQGGISSPWHRACRRQSPLTPLYQGGDKRLGCWRPEPTANADIAKRNLRHAPIPIHSHKKEISSENQKRKAKTNDLKLKTSRCPNPSASQRR